MFNKIDENILNKINVNNYKNNVIDCIVYGNKTLVKDNIFFNNIKKPYESIDFINAICAKLNIDDIINLAKSDEVKYISSTSKVLSCVNVSKKIINVENYKIKSNGDFSVAVIDTGVYPHLDFVLGKNNLIAFHDVINNRTIPYDDNGHGTFVSGLIFSKGFMSCGKYSGVDPSAQLVSVKALDCNGETSSVNILKAMQWVYDNRVKYNIKVVCMSFGSVLLNSNDPLIIGAESLWDAGIIVCSASGNAGPLYSTIKSPGASNKIITVGALNDYRDEFGNYDVSKFKVADFSSRGPALNNYKPDCVVSGVDVCSACNYGLNKKFYNLMSGTSVATPIVAGVASLILKNNKLFTPNQVKNFILNNCKQISGDRNAEGKGLFAFKNSNR